MELNYLRAFYEVAKDGSFTAAARRLHISQSALSKAVALLEGAEGVRLLARSKAGVALTPIGREIFLKAEKLFALAVEIEATCRGHEETCEGLLALGASDHVGLYLLLPLLKKMQESYPRVLPRIVGGVPSENIERMLAGEVEFTLSFTRVNLPKVKYETIAEMAMAVVVHPDLVAKEKSPRFARVVEMHGLLGSPKTQYQFHPLSPLLAAMKRPPRLTLEASSQETQKRYCLLGGGVAYLTRFMVEEELRDGRLIELPLKSAPSVPLLLATRRDRELSLSARTFLRMLKETRVA